MSLLAAFVAMLGKQWLNRYLRHAGGSVIERCGDRQRKSDGLEKWPFRFFIESLPIMLQNVLLLRSVPLLRSSSYFSPFSASPSMSGSWLPGRTSTSTHSKQQLRRVSGISKTARQPEDRRRARPRSISSSSSTLLGGTPHFFRAPPCL